MIIAKIIVPLLNANEPEAMVAAVHKKDGEAVRKEEILFTIETTKATSEIIASSDGFVHNIKKEGDTVSVGDILAVLTDTSDKQLQSSDIEQIKSDLSHIDEADIKKRIDNFRITKPAEKLATELGIDINLLPSNRLITEAVVKEYASNTVQFDFNPSDFENEPIIIYGGGGHSKTIIDLLKKVNEYTIAGIIDDNPALLGKNILDVPVIGTGTFLSKLKKLGIRYAINCVGGILDINIRLRITNIIKQEGFSVPVLIHPSVIMEPSAKISNGAQLLANSYIGSEAHIGEDTIINTNSVISHDCSIGQHTHIAPGCLLAGHVRVGERTLIGMGVTTSIGISIGSDVRIGNGSILLGDVPDHTIIQAGRHWAGNA